MNTLVPATLRVANTQIIMAEVYYTYTPAVGYVITGGINLNDRMYFVPRLVTNVKLCRQPAGHQLLVLSRRPLASSQPSDIRFLVRRQAVRRRGLWRASVRRRERGRLRQM